MKRKEPRQTDKAKASKGQSRDLQGSESLEGHKASKGQSMLTEALVMLKVWKAKTLSLLNKWNPVFLVSIALVCVALIGVTLLILSLFFMSRKSSGDTTQQPLLIATEVCIAILIDTTQLLYSPFIQSQINSTIDAYTAAATNDEALALIPYKRPVYEENIIGSTQYLLLACSSFTENSLRLAASIQPNFSEFFNTFVVKIHELYYAISTATLEDERNSSYYMVSVFISDWILLFNTIISYIIFAVVAIRSKPVLFGTILSAAVASFILLVVTKTAIGEYYPNQGAERSAQTESPKIKKTIRYNASAHSDNIHADKSSELTNHDDSNDYDAAKLAITPLVPFAIDIAGHRTVPIEIRMDHNVSKHDPEISTRLHIDQHNHFYSPTKISPKNNAALDVNPSRLLSNNDPGIYNAEKSSEDTVKSILLKAVEFRLTPSKPQPVASVTTPRATYVQNLSQTFVTPHLEKSPIISPIKATFTPPKTALTPPKTVLTPPRFTKMRASTGTQTDKSTLRDGVASSRGNRMSTTSIGDDYHKSARKIVNVPAELSSTLSRRGTVMAPPKGSPTREVGKTSFSSIGSGSSDINRRKTPTKSSFSSTGSDEDRNNHTGIGPLTSLLTKTYDSRLI